MPRNHRVGVVWELRSEPGEEAGTIVVDVDAPLRPFGSVHTPPRTLFAGLDTEPDGEPVSDAM